jgi:hypothetical protein
MFLPDKLLSLFLQMLQVSAKILNLRTEEFYNIGHRANIIKPFTEVTYKCSQQARVFVPDKLF